LTVKEHLMFQAKVRMDNDIPFSERMKRVETVMAEVKLSALLLWIHSN
jgi:ABC-type multidrug transport system ATPase subunit